MLKAVDSAVIAFGLLVIGSALLGNREKIGNSYSLQTMNCTKGIFAILIVLFHLSQHINGGILFKIIGDTGYLSVAVFFFISGYGMYTRVMQNRGGYCSSIVSHRIPIVLLPWIIATMIYALFWFLEGGIERILEICNNHENGYLLITNSWFVVVIAIFYLIFYFAFRRCDGDFKRGIRGTMIGVSLFIVIAYMIGLGGWWYYSSFGFVLGIIWKENEVKINRIAEQKWFLFLAEWGCVFIIGYVIRFVNSRFIHSPVIHDASFLLASVAFAGAIFTLLKKIIVNSKIMNFLGKISFEIYLLHELIYNFLRNENLCIYIANDLLYVCLVVILSVGSAYVFNTFIVKRCLRKI